MTRTEFTKSFSLLESAFGQQGAERRQFYFRQFEHVQLWAFDRAMRRIVDIRDDGYGFPLVAEINTALDEVMKQRSAADDADMTIREYCQRCSNRGFYPSGKTEATLCGCRIGRLKQARMRLGLSARRTEIEEYVRTKLPPAERSMHGFQEKNLLGFWEDTQEEHDRWMAAKRTEIEEIKEREAARPEKIPSPSDELRFKDIKDAIARIKFREQMVEPVEREPGEDEEEEEEIGF